MSSFCGPPSVFRKSLSMRQSRKSPKRSCSNQFSFPTGCSPLYCPTTRTSQASSSLMVPTCSQLC